ncbi:MAG: linear amide C-N hydrolase [Lachnospiraceae bacterium]|nr:linear amide C-N hydrolase [Lachnospiraceae bacterium]
MEQKKGKKSKKKVVKIILFVILICLLLFIAGAWSMFGDKIKAASSVERITDGLYVMEYEGDYGFADFLKQGGAKTSDEMAAYIVSFLSNGFYKPEDVGLTTVDYGCSTLYAKSNCEVGGQEYLMGRNYDWESCDAVIVHTLPKDGYESYSTCCLEFLGFGDTWKPEGFANQYMALAAIYVPVDGMNEKGLCIADLMAGDEIETHQNTDKADLTTTAAIRMILDYAANVDEALALLEQYDMNSDIGTAHHYAIADASGRSVVVEYVDGEMIVTESEVLTNHYLAEAKAGIGNEQSHIRFDNLQEILQNNNGELTSSELKGAMQSVAQSNFNSGEVTQWTILYHTGDLAVEYYWNEQYENGYTFQINED